MPRENFNFDSNCPVEHNINGVIHTLTKIISKTLLAFKLEVLIEYLQYFEHEHRCFTFTIQ